VSVPSDRPLAMFLEEALVVWALKVVCSARRNRAAWCPYWCLTRGLALGVDSHHSNTTVPILQGFRLFKPTAPDATSAKGKYVYTLDLEADPGDPADYKGTMTLDWTMTIVKAHSKSEFHAVYKGKATATFDPAGGAVYDGHANGSVKTTDTFTAYGTKQPPNTSSDWFAWGFKTPK